MIGVAVLGLSALLVVGLGGAPDAGADCGGGVIPARPAYTG